MINQSPQPQAPFTSLYFPPLPFRLSSLDSNFIFSHTPPPPLPFHLLSLPTPISPFLRSHFLSPSFTLHSPFVFFPYTSLSSMNPSFSSIPDGVKTNSSSGERVEVQEHHTGIGDYAIVGYRGECLVLPSFREGLTSLPFPVDMHQSVIGLQELSAVRDNSCAFLSINFMLPNRLHLVSNPPRGYSSIYLDAFEFGLRISLPFAVEQILSRLRIAPSQLVPNSWWYLIEACSLWRSCRLPDITPEEFFWLFSVGQCPDNSGLCFITPSIREPGVFFTGGPSLNTL